jgi:hypothetical protein
MSEFFNVARLDGRLIVLYQPIHHTFKERLERISAFGRLRNAVWLAGDDYLLRMKFLLQPLPHSPAILGAPVVETLLIPGNERDNRALEVATLFVALRQHRRERPRLSVRIYPSTYKWLKQLAGKRCVSLAQAVSDAVKKV